MIIIKQSRFNTYILAEDGTKLAFNSRTCGLAVVDDDYEKLMMHLEQIDDENIPEGLEETYYAAKEGTFIVDDAFDEISDLYTKRLFQKYSTESLGLTIAPTLACNFKCVYCYETSKNGIMKKKVMSAIKRFVENQAPYLKNLSVSWYGGEPLLGTEIIYELSEKFMEICSQYKIEYNAFIISNGSLLNDDVIDQLIKYRVHGIQITIDGPPKIHDARRVNKRGDSTFDLIIDNINKILKKGQMEVVIRINVDKTNENDIENLLKILSEKLINKQVRITFGQVTAYTEACRSIESTCFDNGEFAIKLLQYYSIIKKYGFGEYNEFPYPEAKLNYCCAELLNSFVVDHEGYLYKCWNEVGNVNSAIGNIMDTEFDIAGYKNGVWINQNPMIMNKCRECELLPVCMGGCPHNTVVLRKENQCDLVKYNIQDIMRAYYEMSKEMEK